MFGLREWLYEFISGPHEPYAFLGIGLFFAVHCTRAGLKELRNGVAEAGREYVRDEEPIAFWFCIVLTFLAAAMGLFFIANGVKLLIWGN